MYYDLHHDLRLFDLLFLAASGLPKTPQKPHPETFGEGGSTLGDAAFVVRYILPLPPSDRLRLIIPWDDPRLSLFSWLLPLALIWFKSPDKYLSSHTNPDDPCLLNDVVDLCKPSIFFSFSLLVLVFCGAGGGVGGVVRGFLLEQGGGTLSPKTTFSMRCCEYMREWKKIKMTSMEFNHQIWYKIYTYMEK